MLNELEHTYFRIENIILFPKDLILYSLYFIKLLLFSLRELKYITCVLYLSLFSETRFKMMSTSAITYDSI